MIEKQDNGGIRVMLGHGDVKVCPGKVIDTDYVGIGLCPMEKAVPVGTQFPEDVGKLFDEGPRTVALLFRRPEDVARFIQQLAGLLIPGEGR